MAFPATPVSGTAGSVSIISGGTTVVNAVHQWSLNIGRDTPEITAMGDEWRYFLNGLGNWDGSFQLHKDINNSGQVLLRNQIIGGSAAVLFRFQGGTNYYQGSALVTGISPELAYDGVWGEGNEIKGSGPITFT